MLSQPLFATPQCQSSGTQKVARTASPPHTPIRLNKTKDGYRVKLCDKLGSNNPGKEVAIVEIGGFQSALEASVMCSTCGSGPVVFEQDYSTQIGLYANPSLYCTSCETETPIPFAFVDNSKSLLINRKSVFANKCVGRTHSSLNTFCAMMEMPTPFSKNSYREHTLVINDHCIKEAEASMDRTRQEV